MTSLPILPWFQTFAQRLPWTGRSQSRVQAPIPPVLSQPLSQPRSSLPAWVAAAPLALKYYDLLAPLSWHTFPERDLTWPHNTVVAPYAAFVVAYLVQLDQGLPNLSSLRRFLVDHPALLWLCGFPLTLNGDVACGFDADASLPTARHFTRVLRQMPNALLQFLLTQSVTCLQQTVAGSSDDFAQTIVLDTKHILAWVKENNPKTYVPDRFDKANQPNGDPDCRLGCKRRHNQGVTPAKVLPTPTAEPVPAHTLAVGEFYWGYASGIVVAKLAGGGEFVLAELTQPFDQADVSYFFPLMTQVEARLGHKPKYGALDAAYDAFYIYDYFHSAGGFAAIPWADRQTHKKQFSPECLPLCAAGLAMPRRSTFTQTKHCLVPHECARYACPLRYPQPTGAACPIDHKNWTKGGCLTTLPTAPGARIRHQLDRNSTDYKTLYNQRSACERINSQATALGIEHPKLRNGQAIANRNTLIYLLINLRLLRRIRETEPQPLNLIR